jgi:hypothetical protein
MSFRSEDSRAGGRSLASSLSARAGDWRDGVGNELNKGGGFRLGKEAQERGRRLSAIWLGAGLVEPQETTSIPRAFQAVYESCLLLPFIPKVKSRSDLTPDLPATIVTWTACAPEVCRSLAGYEPRMASPLDTI